MQPTAYDMKPSFLGGGTVGANWQPTPFTLLGLENNFGYLNLKGSISAESASDRHWRHRCNAQNSAIGMTPLTARVGAVDGHAMFYVKGGGAAVRYSAGVVDNGLRVTLNTTTTKTLTGYAAGGGVEYGIDMHWSVKAEYLFWASRGTQLLRAGRRLAPRRIHRLHHHHTPAIQTISLGLNYRFH